MTTTIKPILFSTEMVKALLDGRKTQTRRIVKYSKKIKDAKIGFSAFTDNDIFEVRGVHENGQYGASFFKLKYQVGDILWVRETYSQGFIENGNHTGPFFKADGERNVMWKPSIFMPRTAARIFLEVTAVRIERLQDISEDDAIDEGIEIHEVNHGDDYSCYPRDYNKTIKSSDGWPYFKEGQEIKSFQSLWNSINGSDSWEGNPFVFVYEFKKVERPNNF